MSYFFIGVAGAGMSALAQFMAMQGHKVSGSDRLFVSKPDHPVAKKLEKAGIEIFPQGQSVIPADAVVVVSTAIEESVPELRQAKQKGLKILHRTDLLREVTLQYKTIAVAGTSGKSTTTAMIFHILQKAGYEPSIITGAPLKHLQAQGLVGNAWYGSGQWLVIEADESDGTVSKYQPEIGVLLNVDVDHMDLEQLHAVFSQYIRNSTVNVLNSVLTDDFGTVASNVVTFGWQGQGGCDICGSNIKVTWQGVSFSVNGQPAVIPVLGEHNAENALAAIAAAKAAGIDYIKAAGYLRDFSGIFRRMQVIYRGINFSVIDDYAHNPAKIEAALRTVQNLSPQVIAWFQPHGFSPLKLWGDELVRKVAGILRKQDIFVMSPVYYAGGTAPKDVCAKDYVKKLQALGVNAYFLDNRKKLPDFIKENAQPPTTVLLMGARDPMLDYFANYVSNYVIYFDK